MSQQPLDITQPSLCAPVQVARLGPRKPYPFDLAPDAALRAAIAEALGLDALRKFRFQGALQPLGKHDWELTASLGATVVQPCAVTLAPVTTRIDERVIRRFVADMPVPQGLEVEMPEDDTLEPLGAQIDLSALAIEALSLAIPAFPRVPEAALSETGQISTDAEAPAQDAGARPKPFAALAALKDKLEAKGPKDPDPTS